MTILSKVLIPLNTLALIYLTLNSILRYPSVELDGLGENAIVLNLHSQSPVRSAAGGGKIKLKHG